MALDSVLAVFMPGVVEAIQLSSHHLVFDTRLAVQSASGQWGQASIQVDVLMYSFSLPTLIAMLWASRGLGRPVRTTGLAYLVLLPTWLWSLGFWFAKAVTFDLGYLTNDNEPKAGLTLELIALGYQFGTLILPSLAVVFIWGWLCPRQLQALYGVTMQESGSGRKLSATKSRSRKKSKRT